MQWIQVYARVYPNRQLDRQLSTLTSTFDNIRVKSRFIYYNRITVIPDETEKAIGQINFRMECCMIENDEILSNARFSGKSENE